MCSTRFAAGTFLGMSQSEMAGHIDLAHAKNGPECERIIVHLMRSIADTVLAEWEAAIVDPEHHHYSRHATSSSSYNKFYNFSTNNRNNTTTQEDIDDRMRAAGVAVRDERSLLMFLCDKRGGKHGIERLLHFFCYNFMMMDTSPQQQPRGLLLGLKRLKDSLFSMHAMLLISSSASHQRRAAWRRADDDDAPRGLAAMLR